MRHENASILELDGKEVSEFTPSKPREKWLRKRTHVKIRVGSALLPWLHQEVRTRWFHFPFCHVRPQNVTANHRVNDAVFTEDGAQTVTGRFMYGPLDMVTLTGEKVRPPYAILGGRRSRKRPKFCCCPPLRSTSTS